MKRPDDIPPYNYCDYRCEECEYMETCKVYQKDRERRLMHQLKGEDPDDMRVVMEDVKESFEEAMDMLRNQAEELGIDLNDISDDEARQPPEPEVFPLYRQSHEFTLKSHDLLKRLRETGFSEPSLKEEVDNFSWHHTVVSAKLARALTGKWEGDDFSMEDATMSAQVALRSVCFCEGALKKMLNEIPELFNEILELLDLAKGVREGIEEEFQLT